MKIEIVTPYQQVLSDEVDELYAVGPKGEFGILPGYTHYVTPLEIGRLYYRKGTKTQALLVDGGFLEVFEDKIVVLANLVEKSEDMDLNKSKQELDRLDKQLAQGNLESDAFTAALAHRAKEQVRVQVAGEKV